MKSYLLVAGGALLALAPTLSARSQSTEPESAPDLATALAAAVESADELAQAPAADDKAWLGVTVEQREDGVYLSGTTEGGPAAEAGLEVGDKILRFSGIDVDSIEGLVEVLGTAKPGKQVKLRVARGDEALTIRVELGSQEARDASGDPEPAKAPKPPAAGKVESVPALRLLPPAAVEVVPEIGHLKKLNAEEFEALGALGYVGTYEAPDDGAYLGVYLEDREQGVFFSGIVDGTPAAEAGLEAGDQLMAIDRNRLRSSSEVTETMAGLEPGQEVTLILRRGEERLKVPVVLGQREVEYAIAIGGEPIEWDAIEEIEEIEPDEPMVVELVVPDEHEFMGGVIYGVSDDRAYLGVSLGGEGDEVEILDVVDDSPAEAAGLQAGDVILRVGKARVRSYEELVEALDQHQPGDTTSVRVRREGQTQTFQVELGAQPNQFFGEEFEFEDFAEEDFGIHVFGEGEGWDVEAPHGDFFFEEDVHFEPDAGEFHEMHQLHGDVVEHLLQRLDEIEHHMHMRFDALEHRLDEIESRHGGALPGMDRLHGDLLEIHGGLTPHGLGVDSGVGVPHGIRVGIGGAHPDVQGQAHVIVIGPDGERHEQVFEFEPGDMEGLHEMLLHVPGHEGLDILEGQALHGAHPQVLWDTRVELDEDCCGECEGDCEECEDCCGECDGDDWDDGWGDDAGSMLWIERDGERINQRIFDEADLLDRRGGVTPRIRVRVAGPQGRNFERRVDLALPPGRTGERADLQREIRELEKRIQQLTRELGGGRR